METGDERGGNFELLRIAAGLALVYGNGLILTGGAPSALWGAPFSRFGIDMLFAISGYCVTGSWLRRPGLSGFLTRRVLRMWPGLVACVLAVVVVIGPLATTVPPRAYALSGLTSSYLGNMALMERLWLPGTFVGQQWAGTVNPMLWTIKPGLLCCLVLPLAARLPGRGPIWGLAGMAALCGVAALCLPLAAGSPRYHAHYTEVMIELPFLFVGAALRWGQTRFAGLWRADLAMLLFAGNWVVATWLGDWNILLEWISLPYMLACFGRMTAPVLGQLGRLGRPGYGLFLYAFPIQQLIVARWPACPAPIPLCGVLALAAGYLSWHLVERPVLAWAEPAWRRLRPLRPSLP